MAELWGPPHYHGYGVPQNKAEAFKWCRKAAEQGNSDAQNVLGNLYYYGEGVPKSKAEAFTWYRKAAEQGHAKAQNYLGEMYEHGQGGQDVQKNIAEAFKWYRKAAEQGDADAQFNIGVMYANGQGVPQNKAEGVKWFHKAAEQGDAGSQFNLGYYYETGQGVVANEKKAIGWYKLAAQQGQENAIKRLQEFRNKSRETTTRISPAELAALMKQLNVTQPTPTTPTVVNPLLDIQYDLDLLNRRLDDMDFERQQREFNESVRRNEEAHQRWEEQRLRDIENIPSVLDR